MRKDHPHPSELRGDPGSITRVQGNQHGLSLDVMCDDGRQTGFGIPTQDIDYLLEQLGIKSTRQLRETKVALYNTGVGGALYGIGPES
ncbi:hypothetical protein ACFLTH_15125 [Bacteroidota bacterium]